MRLTRNAEDLGLHFFNTVAHWTHVRSVIADKTHNWHSKSDAFNCSQNSSAQNVRVRWACKKLKLRVRCRTCFEANCSRQACHTAGIICMKQISFTWTRKMKSPAVTEESCNRRSAAPGVSEETAAGFSISLLDGAVIPAKSWEITFAPSLPRWRFCSSMQPLPSDIRKSKLASARSIAIIAGTISSLRYDSDGDDLPRKRSGILSGGIPTA